VGAIIGAGGIALFRRDRPPLAFLAGSAAVLCAGVAGLALARHTAVTVVLLAVLGWLQIYFSTSCNTTLQLITPPALRGRVMGLYAMAFAGVTPFGALLIGALAEHLGVQAACAIGGSAGVLAVGALVWLARGRAVPAGGGAPS
jgi:predicted MFS family arabinose efflux permease